VNNPPHPPEFQSFHLLNRTTCSEWTTERWSSICPTESDNARAIFRSRIQ